MFFAFPFSENDLFREGGGEITIDFRGRLKLSSFDGFWAGEKETDAGSELTFRES